MLLQFTATLQAQLVSWIRVLFGEETLIALTYLLFVSQDVVNVQTIMKWKEY